MKQTTSLLFLGILAFAVPNAGAQQFTDMAAWQASLTGDVYDNDFSFLDGLSSSDPVDLPVDQPFGEISAFPSGLPGPSQIVNPGISEGEGFGIIYTGTLCLELTIDPANGPFEGFSFQGFAFAGTFYEIKIFDGETQIGPTYTATQPAADVEVFFGWINETNANVTSVEICPSNGANFFGFINGQSSFNPVSSGPEGNQGELELIINELEAILPFATADDQEYIELALHELTMAQDPALWTDGDRLSDQGTTFFNHIFFATFYLELVSDSEISSDGLDAIQSLLSMVVDAEIQFAIENPGSSNFLIAYAEFFEFYAEAYADAGLYLNAVLLHFYAWLFASNA